MKKTFIFLLTLTVSLAILLSTFIVVFAEPEEAELTSEPSVAIVPDDGIFEPITEVIGGETTTETPELPPETQTFHYEDGDSSQTQDITVLQSVFKITVYKDLGQLYLVLTNKKSGESTTLPLTFAQENGYTTTAVPTPGQYDIEIIPSKSNNHYEFDLESSSIEIGQDVQTYDIKVNSVKDTDKTFSGILKNSLFTLTLLVGTCIFYIVYKKRQQDLK